MASYSELDGELEKTLKKLQDEILSLTSQLKKKNEQIIEMCIEIESQNESPRLKEEMK